MSMLSRLLSRPATTVRIEPMRRRHVPAVLSIEVLSYPRPWTETVFNNELEMARRGERNYLVARHGSRVVGYAALMFALDEAHITTVSVDPDKRRLRIGRRLVVEILNEAKRLGMLCATLEGMGIAVGRGRFGNEMEVELVNDGPVTVLLEL